MLNSPSVRRSEFALVMSAIDRVVADQGEHQRSPPDKFRGRMATEWKAAPRGLKRGCGAVQPGRILGGRLRPTKTPPKMPNKLAKCGRSSVVEHQLPKPGLAITIQHLCLTGLR